MRTIVAGQTNIKLFNSICIETSSMCNRACYFCPNAQNARPDELMPWSLIEKAAEELGRLKYNGRISPYIYNEPMRDKRLPEFIKLMKKACPRANIMLNTNGDYIKRRENIDDLLAIGLDSVLINIYAAKDHTPIGLSLAESRYRLMMQMFDGAQGGNAYGKKGVVQIQRKFGSHFEGGHAKTNRSGNIGWTAPELSEPLKKMCVRPWRVFNINWTGDSILCCNDYHGVETFGNLKTSTLVEMWNHPRLHEIRMDLQEKDRSTVDLCAKCDFNGGAYQHQIERVLRA